MEISFQNSSDNTSRPPAIPTINQPVSFCTAPLIHTNPTFLWRPFLTVGGSKGRNAPGELTAEGSYPHMLREKGSVIKVMRKKEL